MNKAAMLLGVVMIALAFYMPNKLVAVADGVLGGFLLGFSLERWRVA